MDDVAEKLGPDVRHSSIDVELTGKIRLHDKLGDILHFDFDALLNAVRDEDLCRHVGRRFDPRTEFGTNADARPDPLLTFSEAIKKVHNSWKTERQLTLTPVTSMSLRQFSAVS